MNKPVFTLDLTMAGAISAGAYTAGVMDFLLEALKEWEKEKKEDPETYPYDVKINTISGASAGGMTAAIMTAMLGGRFETSDNNLYRSWVEKIDIDRLLQSQDLKDSNGIPSILDSTVLDEIAKEAIDIIPSNDEWPDFISEYLHVAISVANLNGVPYHVEFQGETTNRVQAARQHGMLLHEDFIHFIFSEKEPDKDVRMFDSAIWLNPKDYRDKRWEFFGESALASGAFPLGLASRQLRRPVSGYNNREWLTHLDCVDCHGNNPEKGNQISHIAPSWPKGMSNHYTFNCVDGGLMNNEPFELLTSLLSEDVCSSGPNQKYPSSAILMVDPFPQSDPLEFTGSVERLDIFGVFKGMFSALKNQARFKLEEIKRTDLNHSQERFLISPTRSDAKNSPIASGSLGGFGGFLSHDFRQHDFNLGRRNCQHFLQCHLTLAKGHPLFSQKKKSLFTSSQTRQEAVPIIPLCGTAKIKVERPPWPKYTRDDLKVLKKQIDGRVNALSTKALEEYIDSFWLRKVLKILIWMRKRRISKAIIDKITEDLDKNGLLAE